ncbi:MAG: DUF1844 domain-containing protein [Candidatus Marinimicrobia bacterium]|nr:DUF1844 domain-containing protein [Candidatus Neomarinimicrobiota bacterium]MBL7190691.1 DUF1844 domain-containing protein [bacterium]
MPETYNLDKDSVLFNQLILSLYTAAWQHLGKIINPISRKTETDLQAASETIDLIEMLKNKTKGNISKAEDAALDRMLGELKLNYIEELNRRQKHTDKEEDYNGGEAEKNKEDAEEESQEDGK